MLKSIAMKKEIQNLTEELSNYKSRNIELRGEMTTEKIKLANEKAELEKEIAKLQSEKTDAERRLSEKEKENEILRKYYDLDNEPSDEIKMKIHIDLEINRLKEEKLQLIATKPVPTFIPQLYPLYAPFRMF